MTVSLFVKNIPEMYPEVIHAIRIYGQPEDSRNGPVITIQDPFIVTVERPWERVLFDSVRDANPFFHVMEFVWMMAGSNKVDWIAQFNKRMYEYADGDVLNAAYGHRWRVEFHRDQIKEAIQLLRADPATRQAVIAIWNPDYDTYLNRTNDRACNTHIYFRNFSGWLEMTVCNRSNDVIWGMTGANAVHMTLLHELVARCAGLQQGRYHVMSNNAHFYPDMPNGRKIRNTYGAHDYYQQGVFASPLDGDYDDFVADAEHLVNTGETGEFLTDWFNEVAGPMYDIWFQRRSGTSFNLNWIQALDWRLACSQWCDRRTLPTPKAGNDD